MPSNILASGNTVANSTTLTVVAGSPITVHGFAAPGVEWTGQIQIQDSAGGWTYLQGITNLVPARTIYGPGVYRVARPAGGGTVGFDRD